MLFLHPIDTQDQYLGGDQDFLPQYTMYKTKSQEDLSKSSSSSSSSSDSDWVSTSQCLFLFGLFLSYQLSIKIWSHGHLLLSKVLKKINKFTSKSIFIYFETLRSNWFHDKIELVRCSCKSRCRLLVEIIWSWKF